MSQDELADKIESIRRDYRKMLQDAGADRPDWKPLESVLPYSHCAGFMFMGYSGTIRLYKHGFTRRYLNVDPEGKTFFYNDSSRSYFGVPRCVAIEHAFGGLKEMGYKRTTPYDEKARRKKRRALAGAGYKVVELD